MKNRFVEVIDINNKEVDFNLLYTTYRQGCFCLGIESDFEQHIVVDGEMDCVLKFIKEVKLKCIKEM